MTEVIESIGTKIIEGNFYLVGEVTPSPLYAFVYTNKADILFVKNLSKEKTIIYNITQNIEHNETKNFNAWNNNFFKNLKLLEECL